jgi:hypothetical protein
MKFLKAALSFTCDHTAAGHPGQSTVGGGFSRQNLETCMHELCLVNAQQVAGR